MSELLPKLEPVKGKKEEFDGEHSSLYEIRYHRNDVETQGETIRFSIAIANTGKGPLHIVLGDEMKKNGETIAPAKQKIYKDNGEYREVDVGYLEKHIHEHPGGHDHPHWHYDGLATLELLDNAGKLVAHSEKTAYCVVDVFKYQDLPQSPSVGKFHPQACTDKNDVGISVGWADYYRPDADSQYIKIDKIESGVYSIRFKVNKTRLIHEMSEPVTLKIRIDKEKQEAKPI